MALNKVITSPYDDSVTTAYHKIGDIKYNENGKGRFSVKSYINKDARDSGKPPLKPRWYDLPEDLIDKTQPVWAQLYAYLKTLPFWEGAEDC